MRTLKGIIQRAARSLGYEIHRLPAGDTAGRTGAPRSHEEVRPQARYAPWNLDPVFVDTFATVRDHSLVDVYRCWELWTLVQHAAKLEGDIIEIGVWRGGTGALMAHKARLCGIPARIYLCDTFRGVVKAGSDDTLYKGGEHADTSRATVEHLVHEVLHLDNVTILEGIFPDDTADQLDDGDARFRLCHVDVDVYQSARDVMSWIWPRLALGGIVVYDDYGFEGCEGIMKHVNEQIDLPDRLVLHNLNGHAVVVKTAGSD